MPDDFDVSLLKPVRYEDKTAFMRTFGDAFLERWLMLRLEVSRLVLTVPLNNRNTPHSPFYSLRCIHKTYVS